MELNFLETSSPPLMFYCFCFLSFFFCFVRSFCFVVFIHICYMRIVELLRITNKNFKVSNLSSLISDCFFLLCDFSSANVLSYFASQPQHFFYLLKWFLFIIYLTIWTMKVLPMEIQLFYIRIFFVRFIVIFLYILLCVLLDGYNDSWMVEYKKGKISFKQIIKFEKKKN